MRKDLAEKLENELKGNFVDVWEILELVGFGKSAAVFRARDKNRESALKIFDADLIGRFGRITQLNRIQREVDLSENNHPNLIKIFGGGQCEKTGHLYVSMEFIEASSLDELIHTISRDNIQSIIRDIACAAHYLESLNIAHRDIKPANIVVDDSKKAVLLDLGVLRSIASPGDTDDTEAKRFVGTLQYSPPELLLRNEEDSIEGWRAVTFYQLGAVLYDLIERKPIFSEYREPYARMVNAVQREKPLFSANDVPFELINLAKNCLMKDPQVRLNLVTWNDFKQKAEQAYPVNLARKNIERTRTAETDLVMTPTERRYVKQTNIQILCRKTQTIVQEASVSESHLPPLIVSDLCIRSNAGQFLVSFAPSTSFGLKVSFHICFLVIVVDIQEQAIKLKSVSWIGENKASDVHNANSFDNVYGGEFNRKQIEEAVRNCALMTFAKVLSLQDNWDQSKTSNYIVIKNEGPQA